MFYLRELSGVSQAYRPGAIRERRAVRAVPGVNSVEGRGVETSRDSVVSGTSGPTAEEGARDAVLEAYARAENPDGRRRRVMFARDVMTAPVVTVSTDAVLGEVQQLFSLRRFRHIPVVSQGAQVEGILSDRDLLRLIASASIKHERWQASTAKDLMVHPVLVASDDSEVREIARVMFEERVGCVPIVDQGQLVIGMVTRSDILRTLLVQAPLELWR